MAINREKSHEMAATLPAAARLQALLRGHDCGMFGKRGLVAGYNAGEFPFCQLLESRL
jgi:hypothetical protein